MNLYEKYKTISHPLLNPFADLLEDGGVVEVRFTNRTVFNKALGYALRKLRDTGTNAIVLTGDVSASDVTRKCVRAVHRNFKGLQEREVIAHKVHEDIWIPKDAEMNLDCLSVKRHSPVVYILLSKHEQPFQSHSNQQKAAQESNRR